MFRHPDARGYTTDPRYKSLLYALRTIETAIITAQAPKLAEGSGHEISVHREEPAPSGGTTKSGHDPVTAEAIIESLPTSLYQSGVLHDPERWIVAPPSKRTLN